MRASTWTVLGDIHLGHRANDSSKICKALKELLIDSNLVKQSDIVVIEGDLYDRLLTLDYPHLAEMDSTLVLLMRECAKHKTILRVLEGTPSHDRRQAARLQTLYDLLLDKPDYKWVNTLEIEYLSELQAHVLYVPDEWRADTQETLSEVKALMQSRDLSQVDIAIMHGQFEYQLPSHVKNVPIHKQSEYENLVKEKIFIGHVHTHSLNSKVIAAGSLDRLKHGEEEPKGLVKARYNGKSWFIDFIENKQARVYLTVDVTDLDMDSTIAKITQALLGKPIDSCIRIKAQSTHPVFAGFADIQRKWPTITFSKKSEQDISGATNEATMQDIDSNYTKVDITKENLLDLVLKRLDKYELDSEQLSYIKESISSLL